MVAQGLNGAMEPAAATRYHALDALRGTMMLLGIYLHAAVAYAPDGGWPWKQAELTRVLEPTMALIHIFRMPLFYMLAGFFAALLLARRGAEAAYLNRVNRILVPFVLGWLVVFPLVVVLVGIGRGAPGAAAESLITGTIVRYLHPLHLWFLEYLLLLYALAAGVVPVARRLPARWAAMFRAVFRAVVGGWWGPLALAIPSFVVLLAMPRAELQDPPGFLPLGRIVLAYALPFAFGWLLYGNADLLDVLRRRGWVFLAASLVPIVPYLGLVRLFLPSQWFWPRDWVWYVSRIEHSLALWLLVFGVTGVFLRTLGGYRPVLRYLCDASYFLYIAHMPMLLAFQLCLAPLEWPPLLKVPLALAGTIAALLVLYHWAVRPTWVGLMLNGRRCRAGARHNRAAGGTLPAA